MHNVSFARKLNAWYRKHARELPWRATRNPYRIWISEVMLQQTTVKAVIPYYQRWVEALPTVRHVAQAPQQKILRLWQGLGYYSRAKNIHRSAEIICSQYDGKVPDDYQALMSLPGFGPYTVGAVLSIAFDKRYPIIDANVRRVMMRILGLKGAADPSKDAAILKALDVILPKSNLRTFNQAMMELGALVCRAREPLCLSCPVRNLCAAYSKGIQEIIPEPKERIIREIDAVIAIIRKDGKYFVQKRPDKGLLADLWEFPGGKVKKGETPLRALRREVKEELAVELKESRHLMNIRHFYTQFRVNLQVFLCEPVYYPYAHGNRKWLSLKQLGRYPLPSGSARIVDRLIELQHK